MTIYKLEFTKERDEIIKSEISKRYNLNWEQIQSTSRVRIVVDARRLYCGILRNIFRLTFQEIGDILDKNHATIIHNIQQHDAFIRILKSYKKNYDEIERTMLLDDNYYIHEVVEVERKMNELSIRLKDLIEKKNEYKLKIKNKTNVRKKLCS
jgi:hypothetical protein|tara:strand:- start:559 stop:1017 length:459 start_codon:yes stop_codon:yes gene_type:complete